MKFVSSMDSASGSGFITSGLKKPPVKSAASSFGIGASTLVSSITGSSGLSGTKAGQQLRVWVGPLLSALPTSSTALAAASLQRTTSPALKLALLLLLAWAYQLLTVLAVRCWSYLFPTSTLLAASLSASASTSASVVGQGQGQGQGWSWLLAQPLLTMLMGGPSVGGPGAFLPSFSLLSRLGLGLGYGYGSAYPGSGSGWAAAAATAVGGVAGLLELVLR
jgi:hypothetical protein